MSHQILEEKLMQAALTACIDFSDWSAPWADLLAALKAAGDLKLDRSQRLTLADEALGAIRWRSKSLMEAEDRAEVAGALRLPVEQVEALDMLRVSQQAWN